MLEQVLARVCYNSKQRHNMLWRSPSTSNLSKRLTQMSIDEEPDSLDALDLETTLQDVGRPRSWSPTDDTSELLLKTRQLGEAIVFYLSQGIEFSCIDRLFSLYAVVILPASMFQHSTLTAVKRSRRPPCLLTSQRPLNVL